MHPRAVRALDLLLGVIDTDEDGGDLELHCDQAEAALCHHEEAAVRSGRMLAQMSVVSGCDCATPSEELAQGLTSEEIASALCDGFPVRRVTAEYAVAVLREALGERPWLRALARVALFALLPACAGTQQEVPQTTAVTVAAGTTALYPYATPEGNLGLVQGPVQTATVPVTWSMCPSPCGDRAPAGYVCYRPCSPRVTP